jgi:hypothetical protein
MISATPTIHMRSTTSGHLTRKERAFSSKSIVMLPDPLRAMRGIDAVDGSETAARKLSLPISKRPNAVLFRSVSESAGTATTVRGTFAADDSGLAARSRELRFGGRLGFRLVATTSISGSVNGCWRIAA